MIKIIGMSDIHLFSPNVPVEVMIQNLMMCMDKSITEDIDLVIVAGDVFHRVVSMSSHELDIYLQWVYSLFDLSLKYDFAIRILRGTFYHDDTQLNRLIPIAERYGTLGDSLVARIRIIDDIAVEHLLGLDIAYKPDDHVTDTAYEEIIEKLKTLYISKVDIFVNHGHIEPMLPMGISHVPKNTFSLSQLDSFVKGFTFTGHDHRRMVFPKVISNGCFESTRFDEMGDKGFSYIEYDPSTCTFTTEQIVNTHSTIFSEFIIGPDAVLENIREALVYFRDTLLKKPTSNENIYIRIKSDDKELYLACRDILMEKGRFIVKREPLMKSNTLADTHTPTVYRRDIVNRDNFIETLHRVINDPKINIAVIETAISKYGKTND